MHASMKIMISLCGMMLFLTSVSFSQTAQDSVQKRESQRSRRSMDENGDGINDRMLVRQAGLSKGMDRFIDLNGDGISDSRECGLGFRRTGMLQQPTTGKQGMGKGQKGR
jgi:hypothetical protein